MFGGNRCQRHTAFHAQANAGWVVVGRNEVEHTRPSAALRQLLQDRRQRFNIDTIGIGWDGDQVQRMVAQNAHCQVVRRRFDQHRIARCSDKRAEEIERLRCARRNQHLCGIGRARVDVRQARTDPYLDC